MSSFKNVDKYLEEFKEKKLKEKEALKLKKQKELNKIKLEEKKGKKALKLQKKLELNNIKQQQNKASLELENSLYKAQRTIHTYTTAFYERTTYVQKFPSDDELYTKYELEHIEELFPKEHGRINWELWQRLVPTVKRANRVLTKKST